MEIVENLGIAVEFLDIDYAGYKLIQEPGAFDVVVAPNCFGDILADLGGVISGSRGLTYGGSFSKNGAAVFQTNHGSAHDLAGSDRANPVGQILALAMLLRISFGLKREAELIENSIREVWRAGWRTFDLAEPDTEIVGTRAFIRLVVEQMGRSPE